MNTPLDIWKKKLNFLKEAYDKITNAAQMFELEAQIQEAFQKVQDFKYEELKQKLERILKEQAITANPSFKFILENEERDLKDEMKAVRQAMGEGPFRKKKEDKSKELIEKWEPFVSFMIPNWEKCQYHIVDIKEDIGYMLIIKAESMEDGRVDIFTISSEWKGSAYNQKQGNFEFQR